MWISILKQSKFEGNLYSILYLKLGIYLGT